MGIALEVGKIIAAIWLHRNWKSAPKTLKAYLFSAILILMGITSMGIFGFLSKSHIEHEQDAEKAAALVTQVEAKIEREKEYIARQKELIEKNEYKNQNFSDKSSENINLEQNKIKQLTEQLEKDIALDQKMLEPVDQRIKQMNNEIEEIKNKSGGLFSSKKKDLERKTAEQSIERQELNSKKKLIESRISKYRDETSAIISDIRKRIQDYQNIGFEKPEDLEKKTEELNKNIAKARDTIDELEVKKFSLNDGSRQLEAEIGPVKYVAELIADLTGVEFDTGKAVRIVIIILIFVFDPLAILLVLAAHISLSKKFPKIELDEAALFLKIAEIEDQQKKLEDDELKIEERKKDLEQENKMLELQEGQVKKYKQEISENKETLRQLKLESCQEILKKENTSEITKEIEELARQKESASREIKEIKINKGKLLDKADRVVKSAKEIKSVIAAHDKNKEQIKDLKSEVCLSLNKITEIKAEINDLKLKNKNLENQNKKLLADSLTPNKELESKIADLISQKNKILEENLNIKNKKSLLIKIETSEKGICSLEIPSSLGGTHKYIRQSKFDKDIINTLIGVSLEIDGEAGTKSAGEIKEIYESKRKKIIDAHLSNREYKKQNVSYEYIS
jgi:chromosome segregation ATPase